MPIWLYVADLVLKIVAWGAVGATCAWLLVGPDFD